MRYHTDHLYSKFKSVRSVMTSIEADVREIKEGIRELNRKIALLLEERETMALMKLSEQSLSAFLSEEPDLYTISDVRVVYR